jgi:pimeloyl-ACP methyl ester carboxylesterase
MPLPNGFPESRWLTAGAACVSLVIWWRSTFRKDASPQWIPSPRKRVARFTAAEAASLPYPASALPGGRDVATPYGTIRVFEWGPETGDKVLLMHGIGTPCLALGDMAEELVARGHRVMLFGNVASLCGSELLLIHVEDFFGRGYSDAPVDVPYDMRLYTTQILLALASSPLAWTGNTGFHVVGYSLGGGIAASFARWFPHLARSLVLVAGCGLLRRHHVSWRSRLLYSSGILPEAFLEWLVGARLAPRDRVVTEQRLVAEVAATEELRELVEEEGAKAVDFDDVPLSRRRPQATVSDVIKWQLREHLGFVKAFMSTIRHAPIYEQAEDWAKLGELLARRRDDDDSSPPGLVGGKVLLVLGASDVVIPKEEVVPDTKAILGEDAVEVAVLDCGHEIAIAKGPEVAKVAIKFWGAS